MWGPRGEGSSLMGHQMQHGSHARKCPEACLENQCGQQRGPGSGPVLGQGFPFPLLGSVLLSYGVPVVTAAGTDPGDRPASTSWLPQAKTEAGPWPLWKASGLEEAQPGGSRRSPHAGAEPCSHAGWFL